MIYRRVTERRIFDRGSVLLGKTTYAAPPITTGGDLVVTETAKDPGGSTLRTATHTFHGSPLRMAVLSAMGSTGYREGKEYSTVIGGPGGEQRTIEQTWKTRSAADNTLNAPTGSAEYQVIGIDTRVVKTATSEGSAATREELSRSSKKTAVNSRLSSSAYCAACVVTPSASGVFPFS